MEHYYPPPWLIERLLRHAKCSLLITFDFVS